MWRIVGLPWSSSRMALLKIKKIVFTVKKPKKPLKPLKPLKDKSNTYDKELGVEFPSSRFN